MGKTKRMGGIRKEERTIVVFQGNNVAAMPSFTEIYPKFVKSLTQIAGPKTFNAMPLLEAKIQLDKMTWGHMGPASAKLETKILIDLNNTFCPNLQNNCNAH